MLLPEKLCLGFFNAADRKWCTNIFITSLYNIHLKHSTLCLNYHSIQIKPPQYLQNREQFPPQEPHYKGFFGTVVAMVQLSTQKRN